MRPSTRCAEACAAANHTVLSPYSGSCRCRVAGSPGKPFSPAVFALLHQAGTVRTWVMWAAGEWEPAPLRIDCCQRCERGSGRLRARGAFAERVRCSATFCDCRALLGNFRGQGLHSECVWWLSNVVVCLSFYNRWSVFNPFLCHTNTLKVQIKPSCI